MEIRIESLIAGAREAEGVVVVVDVFRCFTTEAVAFANGAKEIILVAEIEEAFELKRKGMGDVLMGESCEARCCECEFLRHGRSIPLRLNPRRWCVPVALREGEEGSGAPVSAREDAPGGYSGRR